MGSMRKTCYRNSFGIAAMGVLVIEAGGILWRKTWMECMNGWEGIKPNEGSKLSSTRRRWKGRFREGEAERPDATATTTMGGRETKATKESSGESNPDISHGQNRKQQQQQHILF